MRFSGRDLDEVDAQILMALQENARITMRELGSQVGLSAPAVTERVRRLEQQGVIRGYRAEVAPERIGLPVVAFVNLAMGREMRPSARLDQEVGKLDEVVECYRITGDDAYLLKVAVSDVDALRETLDRLSDFGLVKTSVVLAVAKRPAPLHPELPRPRGPIYRHGAD